MKTINQLAKEVHQNAKNKGWYEKDKNIGEMLALMHSEISEALEADREGKYMSETCTVSIGKVLQVEDQRFPEKYRVFVKGTVEEEMADIVIRVMDFCAWKGIDLDGQVEAKMRYNATREKYHGGKKY